MGFIRKRPPNPQIITKADYEYTFAFLRNPEISRVKNPINNFVSEAASNSTRFFSFKPRKVVAPFFFFAAFDSGKGKLKNYILEIILKSRASKSLDVFDDKGPRAKLPNDVNGSGKHIAVILVRPMFSPHGKWLARRARDDKVNAVPE